MAEHHHLAPFHGRRIAQAVRELRINPHYLRGILKNSENVMSDLNGDLIIADVEVIAQMIAKARAFVTTHPAGGFTLAEYTATYNEDAATMTRIPELGVSVVPNRGQFCRALTDAGYTIARAAHVEKIYAPAGRLDMTRGIARALAWVRVNPPGITLSLDDYFAQYTRDVGENARITKTHLKHITLYVHNHKWNRTGPMVANATDRRVIRGVRFE